MMYRQAQPSMLNGSAITQGPGDPGFFFEGTTGDDSQNGSNNDDGFDYSQGGNDTLNGLDGNDEFIMGAAFDMNDDINGGAAHDILFLDGDYSAGQQWTTNIVSVEEVRLARGNDYGFTLFDEGIVAAAARMTFDASDLGRNDTFFLNSALEDDGAVTVIGGKGTDFLILGNGANIVDGNAGTDVVQFDDGFAAGSSVDGGKGTDLMVIVLRNDASIAFTGDTLKNVEDLTFFYGNPTFAFLAAVSVEDSVVAAGATLSVSVSSELDATSRLFFDGTQETNGHFDLSGGTQQDALEGGQMSDVIDISDGGDFDFALGHGGDDVIGAGATLNTADFIDGGTGFDTLELGGTTSVVMDEATIRSIERIMLENGFDYILTTNDSNVAAGATLEVNATALSTGVLLFDGSADTDSAFTLLGGAGGDSLVGGGRADTITGGLGADELGGFGKADVLSGGGGDDNIYGGLGADTIAGGAGRDKLRLNAVPESTGAGFDEIVAFDFTKDTFSLNFEVEAIDATVNGGTLNDADFDADLKAAVGAGDLDENHAVLFRPDAGDHDGATFLIVDANGKAGYQGGKDFVMLLTNSANLGNLDPSDFIAEI